MVKKPWVHDLARDLIALGGIPFLVLTIARVCLNEPYYPMQFIIGSGVFFILRAILRGCNLRAGIGFILTIFISLYYKSLLFTVFASIIYTGMVISLVYLKVDKKEIVKGILLGAISTGISYIVVRMIFF